MIGAAIVLPNRAPSLDDLLRQDVARQRGLAGLAPDAPPDVLLRARAAALKGNVYVLAGVPGATPHTLRHSIASLLYEQGWTDHQVAALLNHADPNFTRRTYVHPVTRGDLSALDNVLSLRE